MMSVTERIMYEMAQAITSKEGPFVQVRIETRAKRVIEVKLMREGGKGGTWLAYVYENDAAPYSYPENIETTRLSPDETALLLSDLLATMTNEVQP